MHFRKGFIKCNFYSPPPGIGERVLRAPEEERVKGSLLHSTFDLLLQKLQSRGGAGWGRVAGAKWDLERKI